MIGLACFVTALLSTSTSFAAAANRVDDSDIINPNWVKPGWKNDVQDGEHPVAVECPPAKECRCPPVPDCPEREKVELPASHEQYRNAFVAYRKFFRRVFDEGKFEMDLADPSFQVRNIQFRISEPQAKRLKEVRTVDDIDAIVTEIVEQSEGSTYFAMAEGMCRKLFLIYVSAFESTFFLYWVLPALVMAVIFIIGKVFKVKLWIVAMLLCIQISYVITYQDCNNRMQLNSLAKVLKMEKIENPCENIHLTSTWYGKLLYKNSEANCIEQLRIVHGLERDYCDPSEVFVELVTKVPMKSFELTVNKIVIMLTKDLDSLGWGGALLQYVVVIILGVLFLVVTCYAAINIGGQWLTTRTQRREAPPMLGAFQHTSPPITINFNGDPRLANNRIENINDGAEKAPALSAPAPAAAVEGGKEVKNEENCTGDGFVKVPTPEPGQQGGVCDYDDMEESIEVLDDPMIDN